MRWRLGLHPRTRWGSSRRSPRPPSQLGGDTPPQTPSLGAFSASILAPAALVCQPESYHFLKRSGAHAQRCMKTLHSVVTDHVSPEGKAIGKRCPSVCFHFEPSDLCFYVGHDHSSSGTERQCHRSRSKVNVQRVWA